MSDRLEDAMTAMRPELENHAITVLGHQYFFVRRQSVAQLRRICAEGLRFNPPGAVPNPAPEPVPAPVPTEGINPLVSAMLPDILAGIDPIMRQMITKAMAEIKTQTHEIKIVAKGETKTVPLGLAHKDLPLLVQIMTPDYGHAWVHGPAGSGKTTAARQVAKALGAIFDRPDYRAYCFSANEAMLPHDLFGFKSPIDGTVHRTEFFTAVTEGHLFLLDEGDTCPGLITQLNMLLDSEYAVFPDGEHRVHTQFRLMIGANTAGAGATSEYTARQRMDKALTNRFTFLHWDYDETLEMTIAEGFGANGVKWAKHVFTIRKALRKMGEAAPDCYPTPRATIKGARLLAMFPDMTFDRLETMLIWRDTSEDDVRKVKRGL